MESSHSLYLCLLTAKRLKASASDRAILRGETNTVTLALPRQFSKQELASFWNCFGTKLLARHLLFFWCMEMQGSDIYDHAPQITNPDRQTLFPLTLSNQGKPAELVVYFLTILLSSLQAS